MSAASGPGELEGRSGLVELNGVRVCVLVVVGDRLAPTRRVACGTLAVPLGEAPVAGLLPPDQVEVPGRPDIKVGRTGWFRLLSGEVAVVFGAVVEPVG